MGKATMYINTINFLTLKFSKLCLIEVIICLVEVKTVTVWYDSKCL